MKAIKLTKSNATKIDEILNEANARRSPSLTIFLFDDLKEAMEATEARLIAYVGHKDHAIGARVSQTAGGSVSRSGTRLICPVVELERKATGWFITNVYVELIPRGGAKARLSLSTAHEKYLTDKADRRSITFFHDNAERIASEIEQQPKRRIVKEVLEGFAEETDARRSGRHL